MPYDRPLTPADKAARARIHGSYVSREPTGTSISVKKKAVRPMPTRTTTKPITSRTMQRAQQLDELEGVRRKIAVATNVATERGARKKTLRHLARASRSVNQAIQIRMGQLLPTRSRMRSRSAATAELACELEQLKRRR